MVRVRRNKRAEILEESLRQSSSPAPQNPDERAPSQPKKRVLSPAEKRLQELQAQRASLIETYDKNIREARESGAGNVSNLVEKRESALDRVNERIRTAERALQKDITIQEQRQREKNTRSRSRARDTARENREAFIKNQGREAFDALSPEAKRRVEQNYLRERERVGAVVGETDVNRLAQDFDTAGEFLPEVQRRVSRGETLKVTRDENLAVRVREPSVRLKDRETAERIAADIVRNKGIVSAGETPRSQKPFSSEQLSKRAEESALRGDLRGIGFIPASIVAAGVETAQDVASFGKNIVTSSDYRKQFLDSAKQFFSDPMATTTQIGPGIRSGQINPGQVGFDVAVTAGGGLAARGVVGVASRTVTRLDPRFTPVSNNVIKLPTSEGVTNVRIAGSVDSIAEPLSSQARLAATQVDAVSGARDLFGTFTRQNIKVDKPLPTPDSPPLERSFFADPRGRLRPSRLGLQDTADSFDLSFSDLTFRRNRPQAIVFPRETVQAFPRELADVERALGSGRSLTPDQAARLERFQLTPSGQFKPVGFLSREPEITLPPGEVIVKQRTAGVTLIDGKRVPLIEASIARPDDVPSGSVVIGGDVQAARSAGLTVESSRVSNRNLVPTSDVVRTSSLTPSRSVPVRTESLSEGISSDSSVSRPSNLSRPSQFKPVSFLFPSSSPSVSSPASSPIPRTSSGSSSSASSISRPVSPSSPAGSSSSSSPSPSSPSRPVGSSSPPPFVPSLNERGTRPFPRKRRDERRLSPAFDVFANVKGNLVKIGSGLTKSEAITRGVRKISTSALATFQLKPSGELINREDEGLAPSTRRLFEQFRSPKRSTRIATNDFTFIEPRRLRIDTPGELKEITRKGIQANRRRVSL